MSAIAALRDWLRAIRRRIAARASDARVVVVSPKETARLDRLSKKNTERLLKAGAVPKTASGQWCTYELDTLSKKLQPAPGDATVTPIRKHK